MKMHYGKGYGTACGLLNRSRTTNLADVTCERCKKTDAYKNAVMIAEAKEKAAPRACGCEHYCENCRELSGDGHVCTKPKGHDGSHVACGVREHFLALWPNEAEESEEKPTYFSSFHCTNCNVEIGDYMDSREYVHQLCRHCLDKVVSRGMEEAKPRQIEPKESDAYRVLEALGFAWDGHSWEFVAGDASITKRDGETFVDVRRRIG